MNIKSLLHYEGLRKGGESPSAAIKTIAGILS